MEVDALVASIGIPYWPTQVPEVRKRLSSQNPKGIDLNMVLNACEAKILKAQRGRAVNVLVLGLVLFGEDCVAKLRRDGFLRASKWNLAPDVPTYLVGGLLPAARELCLSQDTLNWLGSVGVLLRLGPHVQDLDRHLRGRLASERSTILRGLLATLELMFMYQGYGERDTKKPDLAKYSIEDLAEGFSYLYYRYAEAFGISDLDLAFLDTQKVVKDVYQSLIVHAISIRRYREWEILVDSFGFLCAFDAATFTLRITAPSEDLEKSIRLGFIEAEMSRVAIDRDPELDGAVALRAAGEEMSKRLASVAVELVKEPEPRYVFRIPTIGAFREFISQDALFREEASALYIGLTDYQAGVEQVMDFEVVDDVTLRDLVKAQRVISFTRWFVTTFLRPILDSDPELAIRSLVPSMTEEEIVELLSLAVDKTKARSIVKLLSWNSEDSRVFDIQYQPFLKGRLGYALPTNVIALSNIVRNSLAVTQERIYGATNDDPLAAGLRDALRAHTDRVGASISFRCGGFHGDIDVIAMIDDVLFVFECKHALLPVNVYEMRTTHDYMVKAGVQLDKIKQALGDEGVRAQCERRLGWEVGDKPDLVSCIVMGNRMFSGFCERGYRVISYQDLTQFIRVGQVTVLEHEVDTRPRGKVTAAALRGFMAGDVFHRRVFESMCESTFEYEYGRNLVQVQTFGLEAFELAKKFKVDLSEEEVQTIKSLRLPRRL
jgi:hypothetical protein